MNIVALIHDTLSLIRVRIIGYLAGLLVLILGAAYALSTGFDFSPFSWAAALLVCASLVIFLVFAHGSRQGVEKAAVAAVVLIVSGLCLLEMVYGMVKGREEYHSVFPFLIAFVVALPLVIWPVRKIRSKRGRLFVRSILLTLFLAPVPLGGEGTLLPLVICNLFVVPAVITQPASVFGYLFYILATSASVLYVFFACFGLLIFLAEIRTIFESAQKGNLPPSPASGPE